MKVQAFSGGFMNPVITLLYLSAPYVFMFYLDIRARKEKEEDGEVRDDSREVVEGEGVEVVEGGTLGEVEDLGLENGVTIDDDVVESEVWCE